MFSFGSKLPATSNSHHEKFGNDVKIVRNGSADATGSTNKNIFQFGSKDNSSTPSIFEGASNKPFAIKSGKIKLHVLITCSGPQ